MTSRRPWLALIVLLMALLLVGGHNLAQPLAQVSTPAPGITCDQLVTLAETSVGLICNGLERNKACYGNHHRLGRIPAEFKSHLPEVRSATGTASSPVPSTPCSPAPTSASSVPRSSTKHPPAGRTPPPSGAAVRPLRRDRLAGLVHEYLHCRMT